MIVFKSVEKDVQVPKDQTIWNWLFESDQTSQRIRDRTINGFTNALTKEHISHAQVQELATYVSTALATAYGMREGDSAVIFSKNSINFPIAALATVRLGGIASGSSAEFGVDELTHPLRLSKAKFLFSGPEVIETAYAAASKAGVAKENVFLLDGTRPGTKSLQDLALQGKQLGEANQTAPWKVPKGKTNHDVCAYLGFSSGTTGLPKAVMISHANMIAQCLQVQPFTPDDHTRVLAALPFYHITGMVHQFHLPIFLSAKVYVLPKFALDTVLQTISEYKIVEALFVPPIIIRIVREPELVAKYDLSHLKRFSSGAAPLPQEILTALEKMFPATGFQHGYGMTESCAVISAHPQTHYDYKYAFKVGHLLGSTELRIVDPETGKDCGIDTPGELWVRGPQITMGYLNNPKATAETYDKDGFLHTGDVGMIDADGFISITDRIKDMIKVKGVAVAPAELEDLLLGHPSVGDVAICGISDDRAGERPKAFVVLKGNNTSSQSPKAAGEALLEYVRTKKARPKWLAEIEFVDIIPKSPAGKILRRKLRDGSEAKTIAVVREQRVRSKL